jgi:photosystem II stability/assembly factor-like uncharacterized protein
LLSQIPQSYNFSFMRRMLSFCAVALVLASASCQSSPRQQPAATQSSSANTAAKWDAGKEISQYDLLSVSFIDAQNGWAVGDISPQGGPVLKTTDGGATWQTIAGITEVFSAIQFVTPTRGWMAGYAGRIERSDDGGKSWRTQRYERAGEVLNSLYFVDSERGFAAGGHGLFCRTTNGGDTWETVATKRVEDFWAVRFQTPEHGWIVGEDGLILETADGGTNWTRKKSGTTKALLGLAISSSGAVVAVGQGGTILRSEAGSEWTAVVSGTIAALNAVAAADSTFRAVGTSGTTLVSRDGGKSWTAETPVSSRHLLAIALLNPERGVALGRRGAIQRLQ